MFSSQIGCAFFGSIQNNPYSSYRLGYKHLFKEKGAAAIFGIGRPNFRIATLRPRYF
jgi:hypothetical protein